MNKPPIVAVLKALGATQSLDDSPHGWKPMTCPFHEDSSASGSYNTVLQRFRCHKCGDDISGDGFDVIKGVERCDFATAKNRAAEVCGLQGFTSSDTSSAMRSKLTGKRTKERARLIRSRYGRR